MSVNFFIRGGVFFSKVGRDNLSVSEKNSAGDRIVVWVRRSCYTIIVQFIEEKTICNVNVSQLLQVFF